jgi:hypothetical protein
MTLGTLVAAAIALVAAWVALRPLLRTYLAYRGTRVVTCPETGRPAAVEVDALHAAAGRASAGRPLLHLASCSRWPERQGCGQECLAQVEAAPRDCLARTMLERWYAGKACAFCHHPFGEIHWAEHRPGVRLPTGAIVAWPAIRPEELPAVLAASAPVCWNCQIAETFRREHPDLVVDDPPTHHHA